jgi:hypothetical protein
VPFNLCLPKASQFPSMFIVPTCYIMQWNSVYKIHIFGLKYLLISMFMSPHKIKAILKKELSTECDKTLAIEIKFDYCI